MLKTIAVVGLGQMGFPFCKNLIQNHFNVIGVDTNSTVRNSLEEAGGQYCSVLSEALDRQVDCIITMLPNGKIVESVLTNPENLAKMSKGLMVLDMSSSEPLGTRKIGECLQTKGIDFLDAPVSGGVKRAIEGTIAIMVGGSQENYDRALPVLKALGKEIYKIGSLGSGHAMKALNNFVSAAGLQAVSEALVIAKKFEIDPSLFVDVLNVSSGKNNSTENKLKPFILSETYASGFKMSLLAKDIRIASQLAEHFELDLPSLSQTLQSWDKASSLAGKEADHTEIGKFITSLGL